MFLFKEKYKLLLSLTLFDTIGLVITILNSQSLLSKLLSLSKIDKNNLPSSSISIILAHIFHSLFQIL